MKTEITGTGIVTVTTEDNLTRWTCLNPDAAKKHIATWTDAARDNASKPSPVITSADADMVRDAQADYARNVAEEGGTGKYATTKRYKILNGELTLVYSRTSDTEAAPADSAPTPSDTMGADTSETASVSLLSRALDFIV